MSRLRIVLGTAAVSSFLLAGCVGEPRPAGELARAKTLIDQADSANVQRYAAADLEQARDKLQAAEKAAADDENAVARNRANEAAADAELATARARAREAQQAAEETQKNLEALREEAHRGIAVAKPDR